MNSSSNRARHILALGLLLVVFLSSFPIMSYSQQKEQVTLTAILEDQGDPERWSPLLQQSIQELNAKHPELDIDINYTTYPYDKTREQLLKAMSDKIPVDLITVDQIWLGEFAENGLLTDLTNYTQKWDRSSDWYETHWDGGAYNDKIYGIWAWTDVRGMWYWKDLVQKAGVDPNSLKTWDGYIDAARKLNSVLRPQGIEGVHLTGASHSPDLWYPYLWMLGGEIVSMKQGHPTKGNYWYPSFNGTEGIRALNFIKEQVDAGILPQKHGTGFHHAEFLDRKFAVMIDALQHHIPISSPLNRTHFEQDVGFIPMFPVPDQSTQTSTLMGGWEFGVPVTSVHKELAWELITIMLEPQILGPYLTKHANMPTQIPIGEGQYSLEPRKVVPYYDQLVSLISKGGTRPSIPEYPQIAEFVKEALDAVYYGMKSPQEALDNAAEKSAKALGW